MERGSWENEKSVASFCRISSAGAGLGTFGHKGAGLGRVVASFCEKIRGAEADLGTFGHNEAGLGRVGMAEAVAAERRR